MPITIGSNIASLKAQRQLGRAEESLGVTFERLSSGMRINSAADDAAGLAISDSLKADSRVYGQAIRNVNDGISTLNIADEALSSLSHVVTRQRELAEQAANGVYTLVQRQALNNEANALVDEFNRIIATVEFNGRQLLTNPESSLRIQAGYGLDGSIAFQLGRELARGVGDGTFQAAVDMAGTNNDPAAPVTGDFDEDGILDLIVGTSGSGVDYLEFYRGNGDGTFANGVIIDTINQIQAVLVEDLNNDGILDVVYNSSGATSLHSRLGNGDGTFQARHDFGAGLSDNTYFHFNAGDFNEDGIMDFSSIDSNSNNLLIHSGNGDGTFGTVASHNISDDNGSADVGYVDSDEHLDLVTVSTTGDVQVFLGTGSGSFVASNSFNTGTVSDGVVISDIDGNGLGDLMISHTGNNSVSVSLGNGDGTFSLQSNTYGVGGDPEQIYEADLNSDGIPDFLVPDRSGTSLDILIGKGDGTFEVGAQAAVGNAVRVVTTGDLNGDGAVDVVAAAMTDGNLNILLANSVLSARQERLNLFHQDEARQALDNLKTYQTSINFERASLGASQSRLNVAVSNLITSRENFDAAASRISDADIAEESANLVRTQILQRSAAAVLAQANQNPALALQLLQI
ncbi:FG-GAP-like repeat-containing protein [Oligoflexia bacterium]|nr:FG-GAP-like repeat-containing protein [Oligoflexia bacterium]